MEYTKFITLMKPDVTQYCAFIFDLDGTLIDSEKYHAAGFAWAVEKLSGYRITDAELREFFESHTSRFAPVLSARHKLNLNPADVLALKREHVKRNFKAELLSGAGNFITAWHGKIPLALASNSPREFVDNALSKTGLAGVFNVICTAEDVQHRKPDPEMYRLALKRLRQSPENVLVFEDSCAGITAARGAGCAVIMIKNGSGRAVAGVPQFTWKELSAL
ncbi:MAG: HAD family phosphatase [Kiritimatiellales bacterium]